MTLSLEHAWFTYRNRRIPPREIFRDVSFGIAGGECVALLGREGSGKSTLLRLMDGLLAPDKGMLNADGMDFHANKADAVRFRKRIGFAFQFPEEQFMCETIGREFGDLLALHGLAGDAAARRTGDVLPGVGLDSAGISARSPFTLSLGESRRVALAMLLAIQPEIVIMDEPTAGLDADGIEKVVKILSDLRERGVGVLVATHDVDFAAELATRVDILESGSIAASGTASTILADEELLAGYGYLPPETVRVTKDLRKLGKHVPAGIIRKADLLTLPGLSG